MICACGGGGGGSSSDTSSNKSNPSVSNLSEVNNYIDQVDGWIYTFEIDLSNDGDQDIIILNADDNYGTETRDYFAMVYFTNNGNDQYVKTTSSIKMFARFVKVADFNGDGLDDIVSVDHGYDREPFGNDYVRLLIQEQNGSLIDASDQVQQIYKFWHGLEIVDINNDGYLDFMASALHDTIYAFINDGNGNFVVDNSWIPIDELNDYRGNSELFFTNIVSIDIDNDGIKEIILGGTNDPNLNSSEFPELPILRNNMTSFTFSSIDTIDAYSDIYINEDNPPVITSMVASDVNNDDYDDLVIYQTNYYSDISVIKVYINNCNGEVVLYQEIIITGNWDDTLNVEDVNNDGLKDIFMSNTSSINEPSQVYFNNGISFE